MCSRPHAILEYTKLKRSFFSKHKLAWIIWFQSQEKYNKAVFFNCHVKKTSKSVMLHEHLVYHYITSQLTNSQNILSV